MAEAFYYQCEMILCDLQIAGLKALHWLIDF